MNSACVSSRKGFRLEFLTWKTATLSFRFLNEECERMSEKAFESLLGVVSEGKPTTGFEVEDWTPSATLFRLSGFRARRATARLPWEGEARTRAMPAPCSRLAVTHRSGSGNCVRMLGQRQSRWQDLWVALCLEN